MRIALETKSTITVGSVQRPPPPVEKPMGITTQVMIPSPQPLKPERPGNFIPDGAPIPNIPVLRVPDTNPGRPMVAPPLNSFPSPMGGMHHNQQAEADNLKESLSIDFLAPQPAVKPDLNGYDTSQSRPIYIPQQPVVNNFVNP